MAEKETTKEWSGDKFEYQAEVSFLKSDFDVFCLFPFFVVLEVYPRRLTGRLSAKSSMNKSRRNYDEEAIPLSNQVISVFQFGKMKTSSSF